jgi:hypothetical protein
LFDPCFVSIGRYAPSPRQHPSASTLIVMPWNLKRYPGADEDSITAA